MKVHWIRVDNNLTVAEAIEELYETYKDVNILGIILGITASNMYTIFYTVGSHNLKKLPKEKLK